MPQKITQREQIEQNREIISSMFSDVASHKRLQNVNWLRREISYTEPEVLFYGSAKNKADKDDMLFDNTCTKNLGETYDFIIENPNTYIDIGEICKVHSMLCANTPLLGGIYRTTNKVLDLTINGIRMHAPDEHEIARQMNHIVFSINNSNENALDRAFNAHYELIALQPFDDFNKRTARMIMNWILTKNGYRPIAFNCPSDCQQYKSAIASRAKGDKKTYSRYMLACMLRTQQSIIKLLNKSRTI